jgi:hypothetical protein
MGGRVLATVGEGAPRRRQAFRSQPTGRRLPHAPVHRCLLEPTLLRHATAGHDPAEVSTALGPTERQSYWHNPLMNQSGISDKPWWHPADDLDVEEPLPSVVILAPDYQAGNDAGLPLWGEEGQISWRDTKFTPELLDRLHTWQEELEENYRWNSGWSSEHVRARWAAEAGDLAAEVRAELGTRAELVVNL